MKRVVKQAIYMLNRHFGVRAVLNVADITGVTDYFNDEQTVTYTPQQLKGILLPAEWTVQERLNVASTRYGGDIRVGDREFIVNHKYSIKIGDWIDYNGKRWDVVDLADYEDDAYYVLVRNLQHESSS